MYGSKQLPCQSQIGTMGETVRPPCFGRLSERWTLESRFYSLHVPSSFRQRYQYKLKMAGKASSLTDDRQGNLERIGFVWDSHEAMWMERWEELRQYREQHGHSNVPASYEANKHLSIWVKCQRRQHKLFRSGQQSNMTLERIAKLDALDFNYDPTNRTTT